jgi:hypothetical protein
MTLEQLLPFLIPLIAIQLVLIVLALRDLTRPERRVRGGDKRIWAIIIVLGQVWGPLLYFLIGREEG